MQKKSTVKRKQDLNTDENCPTLILSVSLKIKPEVKVAQICKMNIKREEV